MEQFTSVSFTSDPWYVVYCKPRSELYAASILRTELGLTTYLPEIEICQHREARRMPFFPGYFFIQTNLQKVGVSRINTSPGVLRLLDFGDGPLAVPHLLIETIREELSRRSIGGNASQQRFSPGDSVRVTSGPLEGLSAVFVESLTSSERAWVLLHFLGRMNKVQVDMHNLETIHNGSVRRERQTRGKGRRIHRVCITSENLC
jgi:transcriptional antiterminator RfaH